MKNNNMKNSISKNFYDLLNKKKVLIASHRGVFGGSIIENTLGAFLLAYESGADIVELDICASNDKQYYVYHDSEELRTLGFSNNLHQFNSKEIESMVYLNRYGLKTSQRIKTFKEVLLALKGKGLINLDRAYYKNFNYMKDALDIVSSCGMLDQVIIKSPVKEEWIKGLQEYEYPVMYMPIVSNLDEVKLVQQYDLNIVALEILFKEDTNSIIDAHQIAKWKELNYALWVNSISIDEKYKLCGDHHDNHALLNNKDEAWGYLVDMGFNIIQTDWPYHLCDYLNKKLGGDYENRN